MGFSYCVLFITALVFASTGSSSAPIKKNLTLSDAQSGANELNTVINRRATDEKEERIIGFSSTIFSRFFRAHIEADELPRQAFAKLFSDVSDWTKFTKSPEAAEAFFTGRKFKEWEEHTSRFDQDNLYPNLFSVLKNKLGETEVAKLLSLAMKSESSEAIAKKLEDVQFQTWIKQENPRKIRIRTPASIVSENLNVKIQDLQLEWAKDIVKRYMKINRYGLTKSEYM